MVMTTGAPLLEWIPFPQKCPAPKPPPTSMGNVAATTRSRTELGITRVTAPLSMGPRDAPTDHERAPVDVTGHEPASRRDVGLCQHHGLDRRSWRYNCRRR